jgi:hypothetical protein
MHYLFPIVLLLAFSCGSRKPDGRNAGAEEMQEKTDLPDSSYNIYRVEMAGYDTGLFNDHYSSRIAPPLINLNQPLDDKTLSELYILKNTLFAMKGQMFDDAILASYFKDVPWYQPPFWDETYSVALNDAEDIFVKRIEKQIDELRSGNYTSGTMANPRNSLNTFQYDRLPSDAYEKMTRNGFVLLNEAYGQPSELYIEATQNSLPPFITTDLILHQMHMFYGLLENDIEEQYLTGILRSMLETINVELYSAYEKTLEPEIEKAIEESLLYYSIPYALITGNKTNLIGDYNRIFYDELGKMLEARGTGSRIIKTDNFDFNIFKPHSHYAKNGETEKYYKALTWLQKIDLCLNNTEEFYRAILIAYIINKSPDLTSNYREFAELKTYFSSQKEQFTFWDLAVVIGQVEGINLFEDLYKEETINRIRAKLQLQDQEECQIRVSLMPEEYQNLFTDLSEIIKDSARPTPVQLFAALGNPAAIRLAGSDVDPEATMNNLLNIATQEDARSIDWLSTLLTSLNEDAGTSGVINGDAWEMKNLNAAMASWVQLNERANIQVINKNSSTGDGKKDSTILVGYVEPNVAFWNAAVILLQNTRAFLADQNVMSENTAGNLKKLINMVAFLKSVSEKELTRTSLTGEEFRQIAAVGEECENLSIKFIQPQYTSSTHTLSNNMVYATSVFRGRTNGNRISGVGPADVILVPVEIGRFVYLTRGFVYSFYELEDSPKSHISQSQWRDLLEKKGKSAPAPWMSMYYSYPGDSTKETVVALK